MSKENQSLAAVEFYAKEVATKGWSKDELQTLVLNEISATEGEK